MMTLCSSCISDLLKHEFERHLRLNLFPWEISFGLMTGKTDTQYLILFNFVLMWAINEIPPPPPPPTPNCLTLFCLEKVKTDSQNHLCCSSINELFAIFSGKTSCYNCFWLFSVLNSPKWYLICFISLINIQFVSFHW